LSKSEATYFEPVKASNRRSPRGSAPA
jgi:hypothetical protein